LEDIHKLYFSSNFNGFLPQPVIVFELYLIVVKLMQEETFVDFLQLYHAVPCVPFYSFFLQRKNVCVSWITGKEKGNVYKIIW